MSNVRCVLVLGRQGSGKGVQASRLADRLGLDHVSTGDLLRRAIEEGTPLGRAVQARVDAGGLVADELVVGIVAERLALAEAEGRGVVLDGFPRTVAQAERLAELLAPSGIELAVHIEVPRAVAVERLLRRRVCRLCAATGTTLTCERCGGPTAQRSDDDAGAIGRRMSEHAAAIGPLLEWLAQRAPIVGVDGTGTPDEVELRIDTALVSGAAAG